jgi:hypothetical protein
MADARQPTRAPLPFTAERASASLLLRCWLEPGGGAEPSFRGYLKNLKTGEELFVKDFDGVGRQIRRTLDAAAPAGAAAPDTAAARG